VHSLSAFADGTRRVLVAGGLFAEAGEVPAQNIAAWDGVEWAALGDGLDGRVYAVNAFDDGTRPALFAGGTFRNTGGVPADQIARWDGSRWQPLGMGGCCGVYSFATFDDGTGNALFVGGQFTEAGGVPASRIVRWNGREFSALGAGLNGRVLALATFTDADGFALYAGGEFTIAGGFSSNHVARWVDPSAACRIGNVNARSGRPGDVLFVNDSAGGPERRLALTTYEPLTLFMNVPPASAGSAPYSLYLWVGGVDSAGRRELPQRIGSTCMPTPLSGGSPRLRAIWNNAGRTNLGTPTLPSTPAPSIVVSVPTGTRRPVTFFIQGIIADPGAIGSRPASVTNGVLVEAR
jgi:hypothetical protein